MSPVVVILQTRLPYALLSLEILLGWDLGLQGIRALMGPQIRRITPKDIARTARSLSSTEEHLHKIWMCASPMATDRDL